MLFNAGVQLPVIPFKEVVGKAVTGAPEQIGGTEVNVGITIGCTMMVIMAWQKPSSSGVKV